MDKCNVVNHAVSCNVFYGGYCTLLAYKENHDTVAATTAQTTHTHTIYTKVSTKPAPTPEETIEKYFSGANKPRKVLAPATTTKKGVTDTLPTQHSGKENVSASASVTRLRQGSERTNKLCRVALLEWKKETMTLRKIVQAGEEPNVAFYANYAKVVRSVDRLQEHITPDLITRTGASELIKVIKAKQGAVDVTEGQVLQRTVKFCEAMRAKLL